jgi:predicted RNA-binding protein (virulence factor B family)
MDDVRELVSELGGTLDHGTTVAWEGDALVVTFASGRRQVVAVGRRADHVVFTSRVVGAGRVKSMSWGALAELVWPRNRQTALVAFALDRERRLVGRVEHPVKTLDAAELRVIVLHLARECDRFEYLLTGRDEQ